MSEEVSYFIVAFIFLVIFLLASAAYLSDDPISNDGDYVMLSLFSLMGAGVWPLTTIVCLAWLAAIALLKLFGGILAKREAQVNE